MRLYFAILGVGKRILWGALVSQIYRERNNKRDVSQSENTDVTRTDKTDWTIPILLSLIGLFVVVI